jgi:hypothetical protein
MGIWTSCNSFFRMMQILISRSSPPLHTAYSKKSVPTPNSDGIAIVQALLKSGTNPAIRDKEGQLAVTLRSL